MKLPSCASIIQINELDVLAINHPDFIALITLQGAQLIEFCTPKHPDNWLFLSEGNTFELGKAPRGGIPICWPIFGAYAANPDAVKKSFDTLAQHGFARERLWLIKEVSLSSSQNGSTDNDAPSPLSVTLTLNDKDHHLCAQARFDFSANGFSLQLTTHNLGLNPVTFSQALHSYFPTADIHQTQISGFDQIHYWDAMASPWALKQQVGDITFSEETDRIYQQGSTCKLNTPERVYHLSSDGSNSTVIWNPWIEKSKRLSQFSDEQYQQMVCIETANAVEDCITLEKGQEHSLTLRVSIE
ncbi:MAG: D-hexose-6-phosphate mutarotase [Pseudomonadota bacterium]|nr:D-hexose-6-phosphate mutarotase [Pseudomonadota bacterium]